MVSGWLKSDMEKPAVIDSLLKQLFWHSEGKVGLTISALYGWLMVTKE
ncbi:hypothetical protein [Paenibacillus oleatilyticus]|uniref:Uncharacterized protein n=1 Tax=Paenibacillus oleatilyticus TaxID=2594886 RepID=A0ABV4UZX3_9BACL